MNLKEENARLRYLLWLHHGHLDRLYGDDGELQCFPCDFKRDSIEDIETHLSPNKIVSPDSKQPSEEDIINAGIAFIMDTSLGGE